jgi:hypothetical protein
MNVFAKMAINAGVQSILAMASDEVVKAGMDALLDKIEDAVEASENQVDDMVVLPMCRRVRELMDIPDDD